MAAQSTCVASVTVGPHTELKACHSNRADDYDIHADVGDILFTKEQLAQKTAELGRVLGKEYAGKRPLLMPILKGGFICKSFMVWCPGMVTCKAGTWAYISNCCCVTAVAADLVRALDPCPQDAAVEFVSAR
jgi:hypothetical protein